MMRNIQRSSIPSSPTLSADTHNSADRSGRGVWETCFVGFSEKFCIGTFFEVLIVEVTSLPSSNELSLWPFLQIALILLDLVCVSLKFKPGAEGEGFLPQLSIDYQFPQSLSLNWLAFRCRIVDSLAIHVEVSNFRFLHDPCVFVNPLWQPPAVSEDLRPFG
jgi:hypothetical protein